MTHLRETHLGHTGYDDDSRLVAALQRGDDEAFEWLVRTHGRALLRFAGRFVRDRAVAEEVVQETWLAVIRGITTFEERSSVKTWLFHILANRARTRAEREARSRPFSALPSPDGHESRPGGDVESLLARDSLPSGGRWGASPSPWNAPEASFLAAETRGLIDCAIAALPPVQREVITSRDVVGMGAEEVCRSLGLTSGNQRVLLHRARTHVRNTLGPHFDGGQVAAAVA